MINALTYTLNTVINVMSGPFNYNTDFTRVEIKRLT